VAGRALSLPGHFSPLEFRPIPNQASVIDAGNRVKTGKLLAAGGALAALLTLTLSGAVLANGVGDLYVASSSGVLEVHVKTSTVVSTIPMVLAPQSLVFSPDGGTLYASSTGNNIVPIDIATLDVQTSISMPGPVSALAFPAGQVLVATMPTRRTLAFAVVHGGAVTESSELPGAGNLLAGDRREARVAVAEAGKSWLVVVDPATSTMKKTTVDGSIVALAIDRDRGGVLVATQSPDSLIRLDLTSMLATWTVKLSGAPVSVAALASTVVVGGGTSLWKVDGKTATAFATTRQSALVLTASDEGSVLHVAEATGIEVFDSKGGMQRTLELTDNRAPVAMAAVPRGSSLFLGQGAADSTASPKVGTNGAMSGAIATSQPPTTSTVVDAAQKIVSSPPFQGALVVAVGILVLCWLFIRWYDKRQLRRT
jgi:DNA-binding beta-propeller fold protein YncE